MILKQLKEFTRGTDRSEGICCCKGMERTPGNKQRTIAALCRPMTEHSPLPTAITEGAANYTVFDLRAEARRGVYGKVGKELIFFDSPEWS